jgi:urease accessory protein UreF
MFFSVNSVKSTDAQKILAYQLFQIARELTSSQLLLMKACYELGKSGELANVDNIDRAHTGVGATREQWIQLVIKWLGHDVRALISRDDEILVKLRLLARIIREYAASGGWRREVAVKMLVAL